MTLEDFERRGRAAQAAVDTRARRSTLALGLHLYGTRRFTSRMDACLAPDFLVLTDPALPLHLPRSLPIVLYQPHETPTAALRTSLIAACPRAVILHARQPWPEGVLPVRRWPRTLIQWRSGADPVDDLLPHTTHMLALTVGGPGGGLQRLITVVTQYRILYPRPLEPLAAMTLQCLT